MSNNRYLSRYSKHDTHFQRTDPWRNMPFDFQIPKEENTTEKIVGAVCFILIMVGLMFLN